MKRSSLQARFLAISALTSIAALLLAAYAIGEVLRDVVMDGAEEVFVAQQALMREAVTRDAVFEPDKVVFLQEFSQQPDLWGWSVYTRRGHWGTGPAYHIVELARRDEEGGGTLQLALGATAAGKPVHVRQWTGPAPDGSPMRITIIGPDSLFNVPFDKSRQLVWTSLGVVALTISAIVAVQFHFGFAPLRDLRRDLAEVRAGRRRHLPDDLPVDLQPLAREINALVDQNAAGLHHARLSVANLAHGLKTPLATLSLRLPREGASEKSMGLLRQLATRIDHHLGRARSAALNSGERARCNPAQVVSRLVETMQMLFAQKQLDIGNCVDTDLFIAVESEDLDEMLGNLLENACKFARTRVEVSSAAAAREVTLDIEDDGPGLSPEDMARAITLGTRLDDSSGGFGLGLGLVNELAELYGGRLALSPSARLGGLCARVTLPLHVR